MTVDGLNSSGLLGKRSFSSAQAQVEPPASSQPPAKRARMAEGDSLEDRAVEAIQNAHAGASQDLALKIKKKVTFHDKALGFIPVEGYEDKEGKIQIKLKLNTVFTDRVSSNDAAYLKRLSYETIPWPTNSSGELDAIDLLKGHVIDSRLLLKSVTLRDLIYSNYFHLVTKFRPLSINPSPLQVRHALENEFMRYAELKSKTCVIDLTLCDYARKFFATHLIDLISYRDKLDDKTKEVIDLSRICKGVLELYKTKNEVKVAVSKALFRDFIKLHNQEFIKTRSSGLLIMKTVAQTGGDFHEQTKGFIDWVTASSDPEVKEKVVTLQEAAFIGVPKDVLNAPEFPDLLEVYRAGAWDAAEEKDITLKALKPLEITSISALTLELFQTKPFKDFMFCWKGL